MSRLSLAVRRSLNTIQRRLMIVYYLGVLGALCGSKNPCKSVRSFDDAQDGVCV